MLKAVNGEKAKKAEFVRVALELIQTAMNDLPDFPETIGAQYVVHTYHTAQCDSQR